MADFPIKKDEYLAFDALSMKQHIKDRLNAAGVFTDQNYEGSYISTIIDIVAYTFHVLMFYLNRTSTESLFSDANIYENMNRIVKMLDYKPIGNQSAILSFIMTALGTGSTSSIGSYTIPRYSYIDINGIPYSFNEDITFSKTLANTSEELTQLSNQKVLFQGVFQEFPIYNAIGQENEIIFLTVGENLIIDHFNIHVYVKKEGLSWKQWTQTPTLYLENSEAEKFELRFNENKRYEIKFGNSINGTKLNAGDRVAIYFLESNGKDGEVGAGTIDGKTLVPYSSLQYNEIISDDIGGQYTLLTDLSDITFTNTAPSTYSSDPETVDNIRQNAPGVFRSQYRLVTQDDYENYVRVNFSNLIHDIKVSNNWTYLSQQMKYYYDMGINNPIDVPRVLYNQVLFADSCNFNNIYLTIVPKTITQIEGKIQSVLTPSQKSLILDSIRGNKILTSETIILDPIYMAVSPSLPTSDNITRLTDYSNTQIEIIQDPNSRRNADSIKSDVVKIFQDYFDRENMALGQEIDIKSLSDQILRVTGVKTFYTKRTDISKRVEGLSMIIWNPIYGEGDMNTINQNTTLQYFKYPYLYNTDNFINWVVVTSESRMYENIEY
jgi:hypothetical protein